MPKWDLIKKGETPQLPGLYISYEWVGESVKSIVLDQDGQTIRIGKEQYGDGITVSVPAQPKKVTKHFLYYDDPIFGRVEKEFPSRTEAIKAMGGRSDMEIEDREVIDESQS